MKCKVIGIDLAKNVFQVCGISDSQQPLFNRSVFRKHLAASAAQWSPCLIAIEACSSVHYWGRLFVTIGHTVKVIPPQHVKAFARTRKSNAAMHSPLLRRHCGQACIRSLSNR